ncbi:LacI family transcriptional regulator [Actinotalea sp. M2MS4P-6]|uniref:LacI family DNA-binding transcriptional regulator n=1 Tax=Actinotalea sp. M2MS4P-6 TaxID=2983762 RepID=UPI0021E4D92E|nr:LacI family DNA-binding transcriptional regulator [Actinotalea sp. M2MS4P-6]MCV2394200.1 LacI family transcriptional regulator [Actinotalea sp. M2MS4P-6]
MSTRARRASVVDVAKLAGVAVGTVSNVLNRPEVVAPATREKVMAAIEELHFVRNGRARELRAGRISTVGAILLDIRNPFFTDVARGAEDRLAQDDYTLMLASSDDDPAREQKYLRLFEEHGVHGMLVVPTGPDLGPLLAMQDRGVRMVVLDAPSSLPELCSVAVDDEAGGALAAGHLLSQGHERLVFLNGPHTIRQCAGRRAGVDRAVREAGLDPEQVVVEVLLSSLDAAGGDEAMQRILDDTGVPSAVFCVNDLVAVGVQRCLRRVGGAELLTRVAVVGYDDIDIASELAVPLTSVRQPTHEMGSAAADLLVRADLTVEHVVFQPELVVRASSVAHRGGLA